MKEAAKEVMQTSAKEVVELAVGYTKQMVEALTPLAKQAYEIGLLTLQIDAAESLFYGFVAVAFVAVYLLSLKGLCAKVVEGFEVQIPIIFFGGIGSIIATIVAFNTVLTAWLWVKLFSPELWLAHQAVEKILK